MAITKTMLLKRKVTLFNIANNNITDTLLEILDLLLAFKEGVCSGIVHSNDSKSLPALRAPLELAIKRMKISGDVVLVNLIEFLKLYWVLSYRVREASLSDTEILLDESTKKCYNELIKLYHGNCIF